MGTEGWSGACIYRGKGFSFRPGVPNPDSTTTSAGLLRKVVGGGRGRWRVAGGGGWVAGVGDGWNKGSDNALLTPRAGTAGG